MDDPNGVVETATFCKTSGPNDGPAGAGDPKRPTLVDLPEFAGTTQVCPDDLSKGAMMVTDASPTAWYVRIVFDELLDPSVEDLVPILDSSGQPTGNFSGTLMNTQPVTLQCGGKDIPYDGYYQPSGNAFTWPVGPSLFVAPLDYSTIPTGVTCQIALKANGATDKTGNQVPADQLGPYMFAVAPLAMVSETPTATADPANRPVNDPTAPIILTFNVPIDPTSIDATDVNLFKGVAADCTGGTQIAANKVGFFQQQDGMGNVADPTSIEIYDMTSPMVNPTPADPTSTGNLFNPSDTYRLDLTGTAMATDANGGMAPISFPPDSMGNPIMSLCFDTSSGM